MTLAREPDGAVIMAGAVAWSLRLAPVVPRSLSLPEPGVEFMEREGRGRLIKRFVLGRFLAGLLPRSLWRG